MPFEEGNKIGNRFGVDNQPPNAGRTPGVKNRSTIARKVLEMSALLPDEMFTKLKANFPDIEQKMTTEEIATIVIIGQAIAKGDYNSYKAVMDSAYGAPKQDIDHTTLGEKMESTAIVFTKGQNE
jgi:hypothetical protein